MGALIREDETNPRAYAAFLLFVVGGLAASAFLSTRFDSPFLVTVHMDPVTVAAQPLLLTAGILGFVGSLAMERNVPLWGAYLALATITWFALPGFVALLFPVTLLALVMLLLHQGGLLLPDPGPEWERS